MIHHNSDPACPLCEAKLRQAHPRIAEWFRKKKAKYPSLHCSHTFRGLEEQNDLVASGKSKLYWPDSKHNHMVDDKPCSLAIDLFQIDEDGEGRWSIPFFRLIDSENRADGENIFWGGRWKTLGDYNHFELQPIVN